MARTAILGALLFIASLSTWAQGRHMRLKQQRVVVYRDSVTRLLKQDGQAVYAITQKLPSVKQFGRSAAITNYRDGLQLTNGQRIWLRDDASLLGLLNNYCYAIGHKVAPAGNRQLTIERQRLTGGRLLPAQTLTLPSEYYEVYLLGNERAIMVSDEWEGFGQGVTFYTEAFKPTASYEPFADGFSEMKWDVEGGLALFLSTADQTHHQQRLALLNHTTGRVLFDSLLTLPDWTITAARLADQTALVSAYKGDFPDRVFRTFAYNTRGKLVWTMERTLTEQVAFTLNGRRLVVGYDGPNLLVLEPRTGTIRWQRPLPHKAEAGNETYPALLTTLSDGSVGLILSDFRRDADGSMRQLANELYWLEPTRGKVLDHLTLDARATRFQLADTATQLNVFTPEQKRTLTYEKQVSTGK